MVTPRRHVEIETSVQEVVAVSIINGRPHPVLQTPGASCQLRKGKPHVALALGGTEVHRHQLLCGVWSRPSIGNKVVKGSVALPGGGRLQEPPVPLAERLFPQAGE